MVVAVVAVRAVVAVFIDTDFSSRFKISRSRISNLIFSRNREYSRIRDYNFESSKRDL